MAVGKLAHGKQSLSLTDVEWGVKVFGKFSLLGPKAKSVQQMITMYKVFFKLPPENVSRLPPPPKKCLDWPPLNLVSMRITFRSSDTRTFSDHGGGQSGILTFLDALTSLDLKLSVSESVSQ